MFGIFVLDFVGNCGLFHVSLLRILLMAQDVGFATFFPSREIMNLPFKKIICSCISSSKPVLFPALTDSFLLSPSIQTRGEWETSTAGVT